MAALRYVAVLMSMFFAVGWLVGGPKGKPVIHRVGEAHALKDLYSKKSVPKTESQTEILKKINDNYKEFFEKTETKTEEQLDELRKTNPEFEKTLESVEMDFAILKQQGRKGDLLTLDLIITPDKKLKFNPVIKLNEFKGNEGEKGSTEQLLDHYIERAEKTADIINYEITKPQNKNVKTLLPVLVVHLGQIRNELLHTKKELEDAIRLGNVKRVEEIEKGLSDLNFTDIGRQEILFDKRAAEPYFDVKEVKENVDPTTRAFFMDILLAVRPEGLKNENVSGHSLGVKNARELLNEAGVLMEEVVAQAANTAAKVFNKGFENLGNLKPREREAKVAEIMLEAKEAGMKEAKRLIDNMILKLPKEQQERFKERLCGTKGCLRFFCK